MPDKISCIYVELSVNACGGHPVSLGNSGAVKAIAARHKIPLFLDACRILENSALIKAREAAYQQRTLADIVRETCALADGVTMSALKDFLVATGGFIFTRDRAASKRRRCRVFSTASQLSGGAMAAISAGLPEIFASEAYMTQRVEQVKYLWAELPAPCRCCGRRAVMACLSISKSFLPDRAGVIRRRSFGGVRLPKERHSHLQRAAVGAEPGGARRRTLAPRGAGAEVFKRPHGRRCRAVGYAFARRNEIRGLKKIDDGARSKYDPAHFVTL